MGNRYNFKPFDKVLVRNNDDEKWQIDFFESEKLSESEMTYDCFWSIWSQCIPYEGNEHLLRKTDSPGKYDPNKNELFGVKLKSGYVLEVENRGMGVLFPIQEKDSPNKKEFAIIYPQGRWFNFKNIDPAEVVAIHGYAKNNYLGSGDVLWRRSIPQKFTKAQIAEKLGINVQDFEIVEEENKESE